MLIYITSLTLQSVMNITINNQCTNIELTSLVYFIKDTICHIHLPQQVNPESIMKANFIINIEQGMFGGALLYHLRWKEDIATNVQLLVIWKHSSYGPYSDAWLIEHESTLVWDEDKLKRLHDVYNIHYHGYVDSKIWLLDDNTRLKTVCEVSHGGFEIEIIVSKEERQLLPAKPLWIDSNR
jgi:hypothetical protein